MHDLNFELLKREALMSTLARKFEEDAVLTTEWLESVDFGWGPERIKDTTRGIWNPRGYAATLTIVSDPKSEYDDGDHGSYLYRYSYEKPRAGGDPMGGRNAKLRAAMELELPVIMLRKVATARFVPIMPVYVVKDEPENQRFLLALDESLRFIDPTSVPDPQKSYVERLISQRLHQPEFRSRVLRAYELKCAVCSLKKPNLLDAAHIIPDRMPGGQPIVRNGLALCKIHHATYDQNIIGISPDYEIRVNQEVLEEVDGPMLKHGIQEMDHRQLWLPPRTADRPDKQRLEQRFAEFKAAG
ncbi:HNH endonuclease [Gordonia alkaliphila]|uniref:HNH endonuclease n=1 Tax=Gordonia alkaliphila TaxID=1053547 RepID=UPI001FF5EAF6|nr:HNH endonuclease [Gordonia alkaliphila]MCK0439799.1 HNH endonuclease [Gordonia alkaliphila]